MPLLKKSYPSASAHADLLHNVKRRFDRASSTYASVGHIQKACAQSLVAWFREHFAQWRPKRIMDIGAGTGFASQAWEPFLSDDAVLILNDLSEPMLERARADTHWPRLNCLVGDMDTCTFPKVDTVISNLALQWSTNLEQLIRKIWEQTGTQYLMFSVPLRGTFSQWFDLLSTILHEKEKASSYHHRFPTEEALIAMCEHITQESVYCSVKTFELQCDSAWSFLAYLRDLGVGAIPDSFPYLRPLLRRYTAPFETTYRIALIGICRSTHHHEPQRIREAEKWRSVEEGAQ